MKQTNTSTKEKDKQKNLTKHKNKRISKVRITKELPKQVEEMWADFISRDVGQEGAYEC